jgi:hypothetical protein
MMPKSQLTSFSKYSIFCSSSYLAYHTFEFHAWLTPNYFFVSAFSALISYQTNVLGKGKLNANAE